MRSTHVELKQTDQLSQQVVIHITRIYRRLEDIWVKIPPDGVLGAAASPEVQVRRIRDRL